MTDPMRCSDGLLGKYTSYAEADKLLKEFVREAETESIWVSVEAEGLKETVIGDEFCNILSKALDTAKETCIRCVLPKDRFIRLRSRELHHQMLIKIEYSCDDKEYIYPETHTEMLQKQVENVGGYFKHQVEKDVGKINIAFPD